jgi:hypothetical protein
MKLIITILLPLSFLYSCSYDESSCSSLTEINLAKTESIDDYYEKIDSWNLENVNGRMEFLKRYIPDYQSGFKSLNESIKNRNLDLFSESKSAISTRIASFLNHTTEVAPWMNNEYFWVIEKAENDIDKLTISEKCFEIELMASHEIEESLITTFYLLGYSDQYCFNKMYPLVGAHEVNSDFSANRDSINFWVTCDAFDSLSFSKISYHVSNGDFSMQDSSYNYFKIPRKPGINKFKVTHSPYFYGKKIKRDFDQEIFIR